jgi:hypothetical protein
MDRAMREIRSDQPPLDDIMALKVRNRKLQRLTSAVTILRNAQARRRPGGPRLPRG